MRIDADLVIPDHSATLKGGAVAPWAKSTSPYYMQTLQALSRHYGFPLTKRWDELPEKAREVILYGSGSETVRFSYDDGLRAYDVNKPFEGVITNLERATARPTPTGRARRSAASWARRPARPAAASA